MTKRGRRLRPDGKLVDRTRSSDPAYRRARARCLAPARIWCHLCGFEIDKTLVWPHPMSATADHLDAVGRGGANLGPLAPAHKQCNERRGKSTLDEYAEREAAKASGPPQDPPPAFRW